MTTDSTEMWYETKYFLTDGMRQFTSDEVELTGTGYARYRKAGEEPNFGKVGRDIFPTLREALEDQQKRVDKAIKSTEKKLEKLRKLKRELKESLDG